MSDANELEDADIAGQIQKPEKVPQAHGGAIYRGGVPGPRGPRSEKAIRRSIINRINSGGLDVGRDIVEPLLEKCRDGDVPALKLTHDIIDGPLTQRVEILAADDSVLALSIDLANELLPPDLAKSFIAELTARIKGEIE